MEDDRGTPPLPLPIPAPMDRLLPDPSVPESQRFCSSCGTPVGRDGRDEGYCPQCAQRYSFSPELRRNEVVGGRYEIAGVLAHGGLGWLYLAGDRTVAERLVVLKGLINSGDEEALAVAVMERRFLAELDHPNIVSILDFVPAPDGGGFIVMEYVDGLSLRAVKNLAREGEGLRVEHVIAYLLEVLKALAYMHGLGLTYGDLKPDNVMVGPRGVKLIDLGSVRAFDDRDSPMYGTPGYQAPEVLETGQTIHSDLYAAGRMLAELAQASPDWLARPRQEPESGGIEFGIESLRRVINRATADVERRFASADEMAGQLHGVLREILSLRDGQARPVTPTVFDETTAALDGGFGRVPLSARSRRLAGLPDDDEIAAGLPGAHGPVLQTWQRGLTRLQDGDFAAAAEEFATVYDLTPAEAAPKLALALCAEHQGRYRRAQWFHNAVWQRDRLAAAAFGLARLALRDRRRADAVAILDEVSAPHHRLAAVAAIRVLTSRTSGEPSADERTSTTIRLAALDLDSGSKSEIADESLPFVVRRYAVPYPNWRKIPEFQVTVDQNRFLSRADEEMHALITVTAPREKFPRRARRDIGLSVTTAPGSQILFLKQVFPEVKDLYGAEVFPLESWQAGEERHYHLCLAIDPASHPGPAVAAVHVGADRRGGWLRYSQDVPILVERVDDVALTNRIDPKVAAYSGQSELSETLDAAWTAYDNGDLNSANVQLGRAVAFAFASDDQGMLRRLRRVVDITDFGTGKVRIKEPLLRRDFFHAPGEFSGALRGAASRPMASSMRLRSVRTGRGSVTVSSRMRRRRAAGSDRVCENCHGIAPHAAAFCVHCGEPLGDVLGPRRTRVWCPDDDPAQAGVATRVAFAVTKPDDAGFDVPLAEQVRLRILLEAPGAVVKPVTRVAMLEVDRTTGPVEFEVVPAASGPLPLTFHVYRDRDGQPLQEVKAELPVGEEAAWRAS
ncbi:protein kinase domain-containing protein [Amycolatopsis pigmentata]|uniref:Serine/threonine-protein kinase PknG n=1 Tax=Amycolatopsis pigmentata TaxID=450801 RepID=A0ABW5FTE6_9PSEU